MQPGNRKISSYYLEILNQEKNVEFLTQELKSR